MTLRLSVQRRCLPWGGPVRNAEVPPERDGRSRPPPRAEPGTLRWVYLRVLRELAHHCGHADILREQVLAADF
jgi:hypothetical protein